VDGDLTLGKEEVGKEEVGKEVEKKGQGERLEK
jgi:hypothetical protein